MYIYQFLDKNYNPIYIGKTEQELYSRLKGHHRLKEFDDCKINIVYIKYSEKLENAAELDETETYFINRLKPQYNKSKIFDGVPRKCEWKENLTWTIKSYQEFEEEQRIKTNTNYRNGGRITKQKSIDAYTEYEKIHTHVKKFFEQFNLKPSQKTQILRYLNDSYKEKHFYSFKTRKYITIQGMKIISDIIKGSDIICGWNYNPVDYFIGVLKSYNAQYHDKRYESYLYLLEYIN